MQLIHVCYLNSTMWLFYCIVYKHWRATYVICKLGSYLLEILVIQLKVFKKKRLKWLKQQFTFLQINCKIEQQYPRYSKLLTLYTLISMCIFSIMFSIDFLKCRQREFLKKSRTSFVCDNFLYSCDLNVRFTQLIIVVW